VIGYKVFESDWTCRGFKYEIGKTYHHEGMPVCCQEGFHFCKKLADCFDYYPFVSTNKIAFVESRGAVVSDDNKKFCTNAIKILAEIDWHTGLELVNTGQACTGLCNSGNRNSGNRNSGNCNSGNWNSGNRNSGNRNSGNRNSGNRNSGDWNSGDSNSGNCNSGNRNSGDCNSGDCNSGDCNSGTWNSGDYNSGDCNSGNCNSGDWNSGNCNSGFFNTTTPKLRFFDVETDISLQEWMDSDAYYVMRTMPTPTNMWILIEDMTIEEKILHEESETTGGYLKKVEVTTEQLDGWWQGLSDQDKAVIKNIPNFDAQKFAQITGISEELID